MKIRRLPIIALLAIATLVSSAPDSMAESNRASYKSILRKIYRHSNDGDAQDIFKIIEKELGRTAQSGDEKLIKRIIKELKKNRDQLADGVSDSDLDKLFKKLKAYIRSLPPDNGGDQGPVTPPESSTQNA
ncbi:MAG: hypothetical protein K8R23_00445 [Chthoniobacter sp.]|nr:hypothetical protein [Chthoniobacter sp.]